MIMRVIYETVLSFSHWIGLQESRKDFGKGNYQHWETLK